MAIEPVASDGWSSVSELQVEPASRVSQIPPCAPPTSQRLGSVG